jgi:hypothetical protein
MLALKLFEDQMLFEDASELVKEDPKSCFACVKSKLLLTSFSLRGDIFRSHLVWLAKFKFSEIELL